MITGTLQQLTTMLSSAANPQARCSRRWNPVRKALQKLQDDDKWTHILGTADPELEEALSLGVEELIHPVIPVLIQHCGILQSTYTKFKQYGVTETAILLKACAVTIGQGRFLHGEAHASNCSIACAHYNQLHHVTAIEQLHLECTKDTTS